LHLYGELHDQRRMYPMRLACSLKRGLGMLKRIWCWIVGHKHFVYGPTHFPQGFYKTEGPAWTAATLAPFWCFRCERRTSEGE
jgi:hypothetical protein